MKMSYGNEKIAMHKIIYMHDLLFFELTYC